MFSAIKEKSLKFVDQSLDAGDFLRTVEGDKRKLECLYVMAESFEVIEWIRSETKGLLYC